MATNNIRDNGDGTLTKVRKINTSEADWALEKRIAEAMSKNRIGPKIIVSGINYMTMEKWDVDVFRELALLLQKMIHTNMNHMRLKRFLQRQSRVISKKIRVMTRSIEKLIDKIATFYVQSNLPVCVGDFRFENIVLKRGPNGRGYKARQIDFDFCPLKTEPLTKEDMKRLYKLRLALIKTQGGGLRGLFKNGVIFCDDIIQDEEAYKNVFNVLWKMVFYSENNRIIGNILKLTHMGVNPEASWNSFIHLCKTEPILAIYMDTYSISMGKITPYKRSRDTRVDENSMDVDDVSDDVDDVSMDDGAKRPAKRQRRFSFRF